MEQITINGALISNQQISFWQDVYGGKVVKDKKLTAILQSVTLTHFRKSGKIPQSLVIRDYPFKRYIPIRIMAEIIGTGLKNLPTNKFIFIAIKRIM